MYATDCLDSMDRRAEYARTLIADALSCYQLEADIETHEIEEALAVFDALASRYMTPRSPR